MTATRVLVAEHHPRTMVRLRRALGASTRFTICAEEATAVAAVATAVREQPSVCLVGIDIPGGAMAASWEISARLPETKLVMLTASDLGHVLLLALASGLSGYVRTDLDLERLPSVLEAVMRGETVVPRASVSQIAAELREGRARRRSLLTGPGPRLTSREWEVLGLLCDGQGTTDIARRLDISQATVRSHISGGLRKLGIADRGTAIRLLRGDARRTA